MFGIYWEDHTVTLSTLYNKVQYLNKLQRLVYIVTTGHWMIASFQFNHASPIARGPSLSVVLFYGCLYEL